MNVNSRRDQKKYIQSEVTRHTFITGASKVTRKRWGVSRAIEQKSLKSHWDMER